MPVPDLVPVAGKEVKCLIPKGFELPEGMLFNVRMGNAEMREDET